MDAANNSDIPTAVVGPATRSLFAASDYVVFGAMMLASVAVGVRYGFLAGKVTQEDYAMGRRQMNTLPVAVSLAASYISSLTFVGLSTEVYLFGIQYAYNVFGLLLSAVIARTCILPVMHGANITSVYKYLGQRFDRRIHLLGSAIYILTMILWLPFVMYLAALALSQASGIDPYIITIVTSVVCIFYTSVGGMKAVVWTDVVQTTFMFGAVLVVAVKGTWGAGGVGVVAQRNYDSGRLEPPNLSADPRTRQTLWTAIFGSCASYLQTCILEQTMMQRFLALPSLKQATRALWLYTACIVVLLGFSWYCGLLAYATYHDCDPVNSKMTAADDQLVVLLAMDVLSSYPGLSGLFLAGIFGAAFSSLSSAMNAMSTVVVNDLLARLRLTDAHQVLVMKAVVVTTGAVSVALVFVVGELGPVYQVYLSLSSAALGASLGIFACGLFLPWTNSRGVLAGAAASVAITLWLSCGQQAAVASGRIVFRTKPLSVEGCAVLGTKERLSPAAYNSSSDSVGDVFPLYQVSYMWLVWIGCWVTMATALVVSLPGRSSGAAVDPRLVSPLARRFLSAALPADRVVVEAKLLADDPGTQRPSPLLLASRGPEMSACKIRLDLM